MHLVEMVVVVVDIPKTPTLVLTLILSALRRLGKVIIIQMGELLQLQVLLEH